jgi:stage II sporulation protein D
MSLLWCCVDPSSRSTPPLASRPAPAHNQVSSTATAAASSPAQPAAAQPIVLTKPPILGPVGPSIVVLADRITEPEIRVRLTDEQDRPPAIARGLYRGRIENLHLADGKYVAINFLPLDSYLQGVLAKEILGSWEPATYRAQAVAARTFALFEMLTDGRNRQWDVNNDESSQVYGGIKGESAKALAAVAATRGQVLMTALQGKMGIFCSRYSSCIGGASQDPSDAWGDPSIGPLAAHFTGNVDDNSPRYNWDREFTVTRADLTRCIQNWGTRNDFSYLRGLGTISSVIIAKRSPTTGRPAELLLTDSAGISAPIRAEEFRLALMGDPLGKAPKPYSSNCDIRQQGDNFVLYNGHGFGHGIGMSQYGAQKLATQGKSHLDILTFFYPGAELRQLW